MSTKLQLQGRFKRSGSLPPQLRGQTLKIGYILAHFPPFFTHFCPVNLLLSGQIFPRKHPVHLWRIFQINVAKFLVQSLSFSATLFIPWRIQDWKDIFCMNKKDWHFTQLKILWDNAPPPRIMWPTAPKFFFVPIQKLDGGSGGNPRNFFAKIFGRIFLWRKWFVDSAREGRYICWLLLLWSNLMSFNISSIGARIAKRKLALNSP